MARNQPTKTHDNLPTPPPRRSRHHHLRHRSRQHTTLMTILKRLWAAYLRFVGYSPRPCPFSGSTPRIQSTVTTTNK